MLHFNGCITSLWPFRYPDKTKWKSKIPTFWRIFLFVFLICDLLLLLFTFSFVNLIRRLMLKPLVSVYCIIGDKVRKKQVKIFHFFYNVVKEWSRCLSIWKRMMMIPKHEQRTDWIAPHTEKWVYLTTMPHCSHSYRMPNICAHNW